MKVTFEASEDEVLMLRHVLLARRKLLSGHVDIVAHHADGRFHSVIINNHRILSGSIPDEGLPTVLK